MAQPAVINQHSEDPIISLKSEIAEQRNGLSTALISAKSILEFVQELSNGFHSLKESVTSYPNPENLEIPKDVTYKQLVDIAQGLVDQHSLLSKELNPLSAQYEKLREDVFKSLGSANCCETLKEILPQVLESIKVGANFLALYKQESKVNSKIRELNNLASDALLKEHGYQDYTQLSRAFQNAKQELSKSRGIIGLGRIFNRTQVKLAAKKLAEIQKLKDKYNKKAVEIPDSRLFNETASKLSIKADTSKISEKLKEILKNELGKVTDISPIPNENVVLELLKLDSERSRAKPQSEREISIIGKILKESLFNPRLLTLDPQDRSPDAVVEAEAIIDEVLGSGAKYLCPELRLRFDQLPYQLRECVGAVLAWSNQDPLPEVAKFLSWGILGSDSLALAQSLKEIKRLLNSSNLSIDLDDCGLYSNINIYTEYATDRKIGDINNFAPISSERLDYWRALLEHPSTNQIIESILGLEAPSKNASIVENFKSADFALGQAIKTQLLNSQEHQDTTVRLGYNIFNIDDINLLPIKLINSFRETGHSGEMPFIAGGVFRGDKDSLLVTCAKKLSSEQVLEIKSFNLPGLSKAISILRTHGQEALDVSVKNEAGEYVPNPLYKKLGKCVEELSRHYLQAGSESEQYFVLASLMNLRITLDDSTIESIIKILKSPNQPKLLNEALRFASNRVSYSDSVEPELSALIIKELANSNQSSTQDARTNASVHFFNLSTELLKDKSVSSALAKIFDKPEDSFLKAKLFQEQLIENGMIIAGRGTFSSYYAENHLNNLISSANIENLIPAIKKLMQLGYSYNPDDLPAFAALAKDTESICASIRLINNDLLGLINASKLPITYRPSTIYSTNRESDNQSKEMDVSPFKSDGLLNIISREIGAFKFLEEMKSRYGEIPNHYYETTHCALRNSSWGILGDKSLERFKQDVDKILRLRAEPTAEDAQVLLKLLEDPQVSHYLASEDGSLSKLEMLCSLKLDGQHTSNIKVANYLFKEILLKQTNKELDQNQLSKICQLSISILNNSTFDSCIDSSGKSLNEAVKRRFDQALGVLVKMTRSAASMDGLEQELKTSIPSSLAALRVLALVEDSKLVDFCLQKNFKLLTQALPEHKDLESLVSIGLPLMNRCGWLKIENLEILSKSLPLMLKRNACTVDCLTAYQTLLSEGNANFLTDKETTLEKELEILMEFNQNFPAMRLPRIYQIFRVLSDPDQQEWLKSLGLVNTGAAGLNELKSRMRTISDSLLKSEGPISLSSEIDQDLLVALVGYAGAPYNLIRAANDFNAAKDQGNLTDLDTRFSDYTISVDKLDMESVQAFSFSEPASVRYQMIVSDLLQIRSIGIVEIINSEKEKLNTLLSQQVKSLESSLQQKTTAIDDQQRTKNEKENTGRKLELELTKKTIIAIQNATTPKELIEILCNYKQRDNSISTPSLRRVLLKLAVDELSAEHSLYNLLSDQVSKEAIEALVGLIKTNLLEEAIPAIKLSGKHKKTCAQALSTGAFEEDLLRLSNIDSKGKEEILVHATRGLLAELSGYNCDACWTRESSIVQKYSNMTALMFVKSPQDESRRKIVGACLLLKCKDLDGNDIFIIRGLNPTQNFITQLKPDSFVENFIDEVVVPLARKQGIKKIVTPGGESGGSQTNRPTINQYINGHYAKNKVVPIDPKGPTSTFNFYEILHTCVLLREL